MTGAIDVAALIGAAQRQTGMDGLGDPSLPDRLDQLSRQLAAVLDETGLIQARAVMADLLVQRLALLRDRELYPAIAAEHIERPIIAFGEARSGTTVLQMLLGCDPGSRLLEFWEVMRPSPPPGLSDATIRREIGDADWREILEQIPRWLSSHPYNAMLGRNPPECERLWAIDFRGLPPTAWWRVPVAPALAGIALPHDHVRQYEIHRMMLQQLQHGLPPRRWVLKGTSHQMRLRALLDAYPDAIFIWIHRDPVQAIASKFELLAQIHEGITGSIDRMAFAKVIVDSSLASFQHLAADPLADDPRIQHLRYKDFTADPVAAIRGIYARAGLPFDEGFALAMRRWMADNPSDRFGKFAYSVAALDVDPIWMEDAVAPYRARFSVPIEQRKT